ncbi:MAG: N-acetyltransferase, partial [bacterium]
FRQFMELPWAIYRDDPYWVPPLKRDVRDLLSPSHPFYRQAERALFLAVSGSMPVGRIAAIINHKHNEFHDDRVGFFGFFECLDNQEVAGALLREAERWVRDRGMDTMRGPVNPSTNEECGLLVRNYLSPPCVMMTYNPPYYADLLEGQGYAKEKDLFAYWYHVGRRIPGRLDRMVRKVREREPDLVARSLDMKRFDEDLKAIKVVYNEAWEKNWGFVPMSDEELDFLAKRLKSLLVPNIVNLAFIGGEPAGFVMALPDYNQVLKVLDGRLTPLGVWRALRASKRIRSGRCLTLGVREKFRRRGIESLLFALTWQGGIDMGYRYGEFSWVLEDNQPIHDAATRVFSAEHYKTYRIYQKRLPSPDGLL